MASEKPKSVTRIGLGCKISREGDARIGCVFKGLEGPRSTPAESAALARTRAVAAACVVLTAWLALGAIPQMPRLIHSVHFYPTRSVAGRVNHDLTERYLR